MTDDMMNLRVLVESVGADLPREKVGIAAERLMEMGWAPRAAMLLEVVSFRGNPGHRLKWLAYELRYWHGRSGGAARSTSTAISGMLAQTLRGSPRV